MEGNKNNIEGVNKDTTVSNNESTFNMDEKWGLKDYFMVVIVFIILALLSFALYTYSSENEEEREDWRAANETLKLQGNNCEILRVVDLTKSYEPRKTVLSIQYYGSKETRSINLPTEIDIPIMDKKFLNNESYIPILDYIFGDNSINRGAFVKVCFNNEGYIDTVTNYVLMEGK